MCIVYTFCFLSAVCFIFIILLFTSFPDVHHAGVATVTIVILLILTICGWFCYAYFFPHSCSGQFLIKVTLIFNSMADAAGAQKKILGHLFIFFSALCWELYNRLSRVFSNHIFVLWLWWSRRITWKLIWSYYVDYTYVIYYISQETSR